MIFRKGWVAIAKQFAVRSQTVTISQGAPNGARSRRFSTGLGRTDITGTKIFVNSTSTIDELDECMYSILSGNGDSRSGLRTLVLEAPDCPFIAILQLFEELKHGVVNVDYVAEQLNSLELRVSEGKADSREAYFAAAAVAWLEGRFMRSGMLLETYLVDQPQDLLAMHFAQEAYKAAGSLSNVLGAVSRHAPATASNHHLHGVHLGLLAEGFLQSGRIVNAEEVAEKAVGAERGQSSSSLQTLLKCYQLTGRTSELKAAAQEYGSNFDCTGLSRILFSQGCANVMRGSYAGAYRNLEDMFDLMDENAERNSGFVSNVFFENASFLLLMLSMNTRDINEGMFIPIWRYLGTRYKRPSSQNRSAPILCDAMRTNFAELQLQQPLRLQVDKAVHDQPGEAGASLWGIGKLFQKRRNRNKSEEAAARIEQHVNVRFSSSAEGGASIAHQVEGKGRELDPSPLRLNDYQNLRSLQTAIPVSLGDSEMSDRTAINHSLCQSIRSFIAEDYRSASDGFIHIAPLLERLGIDITQRDILEQMLIES